MFQDLDVKDNWNKKFEVAQNIELQRASQHLHVKQKSNIATQRSFQKRNLKGTSTITQTIEIERSGHSIVKYMSQAPN